MTTSAPLRALRVCELMPTVDNVLGKKQASFVGLYPRLPPELINCCAVGKTGARVPSSSFRRGSCRDSCQDCTAHVPGDHTDCIALDLLANMPFLGWEDGEASSSKCPRLTQKLGL